MRSISREQVELIVAAANEGLSLFSPPLSFAKLNEWLMRYGTMVGHPACVYLGVVDLARCSGSDQSFVYMMYILYSHRHEPTIGVPIYLGSAKCNKRDL